MSAYYAKCVACIVAGCTQRTPTHLPFPCAESGDMKGMMQESLCPPPNTCSHTRHAPRARYFFALPSEPLNNGHYGANDFVPCREVVPNSEIKSYTKVLAWV